MPTKEMIVSSNHLETKLAILEDDQLIEFFVERAKTRGILGNIYKGRVTKVLPGMQAAFVDIGLDRHAFLYVTDFQEDFEEYQELFGDEEAEPLEVPEVKAPAAKKKRNRKASRRKGGGRPKRQESPAPSTPLSSSPPPRSPEEVLQPLPTEEFSVLPKVLKEVSGEEAESAAEDGEEGRVLPARLGGEESPGGEAAGEDGEARLEQKPKLMRLSLPRNGNRHRNRKAAQIGTEHTLIGDLLREGQEILVQVAKEPMGKKGARITSHVALPGRYLVFMPTVSHVGVSRKIASDAERQRLKEIVLRLRGDIHRGFIVRTAGEGRTEKEFQDDMVYLTRLWEEVRQKAESRSAPALIHSEPNLVNRTIRDYLSEEFRAIRVDDEREYEAIVETVSRLNPSLVNRVRLYNGTPPILDRYGVTAEIERALKPKVWLKNGGYIVINQTEALVAIDVNTGKYVGSSTSLEETITRTNLGAVKEVARQIRLRDLGGIIVIDFIDMYERKNRQRVMEALQQELAKDKSPSKVLQFNEFGLVAITRKRARQSLERTFCQPCSYCQGTGMTKSVRTICYSIFDEVRRVRKEFGEGGELLIRCHPEVGASLRNGEREVIREIEEVTGKIVTIKTDPLMHIEQFDLVEM